MMRTLEEIKTHCYVSSEEEALLSSSISPIVLLRRKGRELICPGVAPNLNDLGVMLPYTPLHHLLMGEVDRPLVMTSGNLSEEPIAKDNDEAMRKLSNVADFFLFHDRDIYTRFDDSVTIFERGRPKIIRRARGYAPYPIHLSFKAKEVLACGAELKNTFCMTKDQYAFLSPHIGDMENLETLSHFESTIELYKRLFRIHPKIIAHDLHPDYLSTSYALGLKAPSNDLQFVPVQHHHAHIVSCMTDNRVKPPVLGVAFDGTGYGSDGHIWGGEFLLVDYGRFRRMGHLEYVPQAGGDAAIRRPYRMAISYLYTLLGERVLNGDIPFLERVEPFEVDLIKKQIKKGIHAPMTSSAGRLFDGVSTLLNIRDRVYYEAQAAIELEMIADEERAAAEIYPFEIAEQNGVKVVRLRGIFLGILADLAKGIERAQVSAKFHKTMARIIARMCQILAQSTGINRVVLSGGVFQNQILSRLARAYLEEAGLEVFTHWDIPCNDGGVSLGQAVIANFITA
jgi:hydrogenase maturation protein HypF